MGTFELKVKAKGISKTRDFLIEVEDPRWSHPNIFEHKGPQSLQVNIGEGESRHQMTTYRVNAKIIQELPM